jgi:hypothetical protein
MSALALNGGNYIRIWASQDFWNVEHEEAGVYDEVKAAQWTCWPPTPCANCWP